MLARVRGSTALVLLLPLLVSSVYLHACSSDDPVAPVEDAGNQEAATPAGNDGGGGGEASCEPSTPPRASRFVPYRPYQPGACTNAQLSGYYKTCLSDGRTAPSCAAFKEQNPTCFDCIDSDEDSPTWAAIVWFRKNMYSETNIPGCVAQQLKEPPSGEGCGAADGKFDDCARLACAGCRTEDTETARTALFDCLRDRAVDAVCAADLSRVNVACAEHIDPPPGDPTNLCFRTTASEAFDSFALRYIQHWCGPPPDGGIADAATD